MPVLMVKSDWTSTFGSAKRDEVYAIAIQRKAWRLWCVGLYAHREMVS